MKKIHTKLFALLLLALCSCSDEFLESMPVASEQELDFYKNDTQMFAALVAAYDCMGWDYNLATATPLGEIRSDNCKTGGGGENDQPDMQKIENYTNIDVNSISNDYWKRCYQGIYRCNILINQEYDSEKAQLYKAEAKVLRAWYHFDAMRTFGPCVISLQHVYPKDHKFVRNTREEVNLQMEKDLLEAMPLLIEKHSNEMLGRVTLVTAQALLGKVYLYWADWKNDDPAIFDKAAQQLAKVVESPHYKLFDDYSKLFAAFQENNSESIFEIQRSEDAGWKNWGKVNHSEGNYWVQFSGPRSLNGNNPDYEGGWGFVLPQQNLWDFYLPDDNVRRDATFFTYDELVKDVNATITDPKKEVVWDLEQYNEVDFVGYAQQKYPLFKAEGYATSGTPALNRPGNDRIIRLADVYLMLAESYIRGGQASSKTADAKQLIDELRQKHVYGGAADFDGVDDLIAKYPERFKNVLDVIWYERRVELAGEGDRWFDLVRSGRAKKVMGALYPENFDDRDIYLPISSIESSASNGSITTWPQE